MVAKRFFDFLGDRFGRNAVQNGEAFVKGDGINFNVPSRMADSFFDISGRLLKQGTVGFFKTTGELKRAVRKTAGVATGEKAPTQLSKAEIDEVKLADAERSMAGSLTYNMNEADLRGMLRDVMEGTSRESKAAKKDFKARYQKDTGQKFTRATDDDLLDYMGSYNYNDGKKLLEKADGGDVLAQGIITGHHKRMQNINRVDSLQHDAAEFKRQNTLEPHPDDTLLTRSVKYALKPIDDVLEGLTLRRIFKTGHGEHMDLVNATGSRIVERLSNTEGVAAMSRIGASIEQTVFNWQYKWVRRLSGMHRTAYNEWIQDAAGVTSKTAKDLSEVTSGRIRDFDREVLLSYLTGKRHTMQPVNDLVDVMKGYFKDADDYGRLSGIPGLGTRGEGFFPQVWQPGVITRFRGEFEGLLTDKFIKDSGGKLSEAKARQSAKEVTTRIASSETGMTDLDAVIQNRSLKKRELELSPDDYEKFGKFLNNDILEVLNQYNRGYIGYARFYETLGGWDGFKRLETAITEAGTREMDKLKAKGKLTTKASERISREVEAGKRDLRASLNRIITGNAMGISADQASLASGLARNIVYYTHARTMGRALISNFNDAAAEQGSYILGRETMNEIDTFVGNMQKALKDGSVLAQDLQEAIGWLEYTRAMRTGLYSTFQQVAEASPGTYLGPGSKFFSNVGQVNKYASQKIHELSGLAQYTHMSEARSALATMKRQMRLVTKWVNEGSLSDFDARWLQQSGVDKAMADRIYVQLAKYGVKDDVSSKAFGVKSSGELHANIHSWDDDAAKDAFLTTVRRQIHKDVPTPGAADAPIFADTAIGQIMLIFQRYNFRMYNQFTSRIPDQRAADVLTWLSMNLFLTTTAIGLKRVVSGKDLYDPNTWMYNAVQQSGLLGWLEVPMDVSDRLGFGPGVLVGASNGSSAWEKQRPFDPLLGAGVSSVSALGSGLSDPISKKGLSAVWGNNLVQLQAMMSLAEAFGAWEDRGHADRQGKRTNNVDLDRTVDESFGRTS